MAGRRGESVAHGSQPNQFLSFFLPPPDGRSSRWSKMLRCRTDPVQTLLKQRPNSARQREASPFYRAARGQREGRAQRRPIAARLNPPCPSLPGPHARTRLAQGGAEPRAWAPGHSPPPPPARRPATCAPTNCKGRGCCYFPPAPRNNCALANSSSTENSLLSTQGRL